MLVSFTSIESIAVSLEKKGEEIIINFHDDKDFLEEVAKSLEMLCENIQGNVYIVFKEISKERLDSVERLRLAILNGYERNPDLHANIGIIMENDFLYLANSIENQLKEIDSKFKDLL